MIHFLANFPAHSLNAMILASQAVYCMITQSLPMLGGTVLRSTRPVMYTVGVTLLSLGAGVHLFGIHF